jgi:hypothetical protein
MDAAVHIEARLRDASFIQEILAVSFNRVS